MMYKYFIAASASLLLFGSSLANAGFFHPNEIYTATQKERTAFETCKKDDSCSNSCVKELDALHDALNNFSARDTALKTLLQ